MTEVLTARPSMPAAIAALRSALAGGLDPSADPARGVVPVPSGQFLLMPAFWGAYAGVKVATVAPGNPALGRPRIQGEYLLLDGPTLTPLALLDGVALTSVRTAAVSALAVDCLAPPDASRLVVFGTGPQAASHIEALRSVRSVREVVVVGRSPSRTAEFAAACDARVGTAADVASADLVACCTTSPTPLFDGALVRDSAVVVAVGSHEPHVREVDSALAARATVVVEAVETALREAGDVVLAVSDGALAASELVPLSEVVRGVAALGVGPRLFKSVGMAWEDLVVAATTYEAARGESR
ncbi:ornithine cyclodeaminase family protein [Amycolatopsis rhabdoformis]|uniref:Ornithine cyclodeaminase family protein n=1 Tax=Amycolatopsis rhabdoformis TaxID=1448059 RepID=A0ABZ1IDG8_9PSEU|nr:ornithine cyclodeaminase family protein [Amycolatopsis rhabdoformis]WSE31480.1 ornithine cyclodeaminase family protein [Amycolatopsis rhabdoformis]